jgi:uncharacterized membrane protein YesL
MSSARMASEGRGAEHSKLPLRVAETAWSNLPLLLLMDAVLFVGAVPMIVLFAGGVFLLAPLAGALFLGPLWAGTVAATDLMVRDEAVSARDFLRAVRDHAGRGVAISTVPAAVATAALGALAVLETRPQALWVIAPLFVEGSLMVLVFLACFSAFSLATTGGLRGWTLWRASLELAAGNPLLTLGTVALLVLLGFLVSWLPGMLVVLPALLAVHLSASTWAVIWRCQENVRRTSGSG